MNTKIPKLYDDDNDCVNSSISAWCIDKRLHLSEYKSKAELKIVHWHVDSADCSLIGIILGVRTTKNISR